MTLSNLLRNLGRRWYLVLAGLLITTGLCFATYSAISPTYERAASVLLLPGAQTIPAGGNPYLYLGGLGQASDVLVSAVNASSVRTSILLGHPATEISMTRDPASSGPLVTVSASGPNDADVTATLERALTAIPQTLSELQVQANVPTTARITSLQLTTDPTSVLIRKNQFQAVGLVAAGGTALTLLIVGFVDGLLLSRQRSRRGGARV
jgi:uncharacterized protein involved in exopolysaccharide biosynthesis